MALVRVYCGLTTADPRGRPDAAGSPLVAAMVDDAGRTIDVCDLDDHPRGYAHLSSLLTERASGPYSVAIAADCADQLVPRLLATAGWAIALTEATTTGDDASRPSDPAAGPALSAAGSRAVGLARALHAGALVATTTAPPAGFAELKPVLAADGALATGRYGATVALREVLRELYPAALRAFPDPADPVALAVIDALPEPGALSATSDHDSAALLDAVTAKLTHDSVADHATITEALTALRVAVAEAPRRAALHPDLAASVAEAVRHAVSAVRACDLARHRLRDALGLWIAGRDSAHAAHAGAGVAADAGARTAAGTRERTTTGTREHTAAGTRERTTAAGARRAGAAGSRIAAATGARAAAAGGEGPASAPQRRTTGPGDGGNTAPVDAGTRSRAATPGRGRAAPAPRPVSSPPPPPGITPISSPVPAAAPPAPGPRAPQPDRAAARQRGHGSGTGPAPRSPDIRVPTPRPAAEAPARGTRDSWPTSPPPDDWAVTPAAARAPASPAAAKPAPVTPPWLADDLTPPEPPMPAADLSPPHGPRRRSGAPGAPPLRLVETPRSAPPVDADESDSDLLIFAQIRSAWFSRQPGDGPWTSPMDEGWRAAEKAANPTVEDLTGSGLPRRVPHANLVPGSPPRDGDRPLRVVRDPSSIAANTSGYFSGWRRGQEVGGYPLGNRVGGKTAGAWEFARDDRMSG